MNDKDKEAFVMLLDWALIWNRQAGGYMASDTFSLVARCRRIATKICEEQPDLKCFLSRMDTKLHQTTPPSGESAQQ